MTAPDPHAIARRLTAAQRRALVERWDWRDQVAGALHKRGLATLSESRPGYHRLNLTVEGEAVLRAIVEQEQGGGNGR